MRAIVAERLCGPPGLQYTQVADPLGDDLVHIDVTAAGVCYPDLLLISGEYQWRPQPPFIPGNEVAGRVRHAPEGSEFVAGQRVSACPTLGGYAERVAVPPAYAVATPPEIDDASASCLLGNYYTMFYALELRGALRPDETVLVFGSAGGIGTAAVQVAKALGARVIAMVHRPGAVEFAESLGADIVLPLIDGWAEKVSRSVGGRGVDLVVDQVGGVVFADAIRVLAPGGRILVLGFASRQGIPTMPTDALLGGNISVIGVNSADFVDRVPGGRATLQAGIARLVGAGLRPPPPMVTPLSEAKDALRNLAEGRVLGKTVLVP